MSLVRPTESRPYFRLKWTDSHGGARWRSTRTTDEGVALEQAVALSRQIVRVGDDVELSWPEFCRRYEEEYLAAGPVKTLQAWQTASGWYVDLMHPKWLDEVTSSSVSQFTQRFREKYRAKHERDCPPSTLRSYLKQLSAAFGWAYRLGLLRTKVELLLPRVAKRQGKLARSRAITLEEFERIVKRVEGVRPKDYAQWQKLLWGYWHSGFRLRELLGLSWDDDAEVSVETRYKYPLVRFGAGGHKRGEAQYQVISREFWDLVKDDEPKTGPVFPVVSRKGRAYDPDWIGTVIRHCGDKIKTGIGSDKTASCHDLGKRAWATRWGQVLSPQDLASAARHGSFQTTQDYYYIPALEEQAAKLGWE